MRSRFDHLGKNVLRDFFVLLGSVETEAEVPVGDSQRIDLWFVPAPARQGVQSNASGVLKEMVSEPAMVELFIGTLGEPELDGCLRKRHQWRHALELREKKKWRQPRLWVLCAVRPDRVLEDFGFREASTGPPGHYDLEAPGWRIHILVAAELPRTRETILLRLMGPKRARIEAIRDLIALPDGAWEKSLALPWLTRLHFEVPVDPSEPMDEEMSLIMETREWFEQYKKQVRDEGRDEGRVGILTRQFATRLGRALSETERAVVSERVRALGEDRMSNVVLSLSGEALASWLADPTAS
jgi:hypothetical protein